MTSRERKDMPWVKIPRAQGCAQGFPQAQPDRRSQVY
jgi:hypothetical protein